MCFKVESLGESDAKIIANWKYESPYDVYNYPSWHVMVKQSWAITDAGKRRAEFYAIKMHNEIMGYFRLAKQQDCFMLGMGLAPNMCGRGLGKKVLQMIEEFFQKRHTEKLCLEVRTFNIRAIKCYESTGFIKERKYFKNTPIGSSDFLFMTFIP